MAAMTKRTAQLVGLEPSFGFGDRIGLATPGHVAAMRAAGAGVVPIFAQQSIREMTRTGRDPERVMADAWQGAAAAGWEGPSGADADHLKTTADVDRTAAAGFTFFTIDPSDHVDDGADSYDEATLRERYESVREETPWVEQYRGRSVRLDSGFTIEFTEERVLRAAVKYGRAIRHAVLMGAHIARVQEAAGRPFEIEFSVDETALPTHPAEHLIVAEQCLKGGVKLISLAPRFIGDMEKGVDYIGDLEALAAALRDHAAIAAMLGPYKLSLHSGSDKVSMYPLLARATRGMFHVKTAGTSYLEALRVAARRDPALFRRICRFARQRYDADRATYHVHATLDDVPPVDAVADPKALERLYLELWDEVPAGRGFTASGRQILHCTFGSVLCDADLGGALRACLQANPDEHRALLAEHFGKHLEALRAGL